MNSTQAKQIRIKLYVADFGQRRMFYESILQWPVIGEWDEADNRGVMYDTGAGILELLESKSAQLHDRNSDLSIEVSDVNGLWSNLKNHISIVFPLRKNSWGDSSFCIEDPGGFRLTFFSKVC